MVLVDVFFHTTSSSVRESIAQQGLRSGQSGGYTTSSWADLVYGKRPVYLSKDPEISPFFEYEGADKDIWQVSISDGLLADLQSLVDAGWAADTFTDLASSGMRRFEHWFSCAELLRPGSFAARTAILDTETAAFLGDIPSENLQLLKR